MRLSTKMLCGFMAVAGLMVIQSFSSYNGFSYMSNKLHRSIESAALMDAAMEMKYAAGRDMQMIMELLASKSLDDLNNFWEQHTHFAQVFNNSADAIAKEKNGKEQSNDVTETDQLPKIADEL